MKLHQWLVTSEFVVRYFQEVNEMNEQLGGLSVRRHVLSLKQLSGCRVSCW
jgi:hypothetical protein